MRVFLLAAFISLLSASAVNAQASLDIDINPPPHPSLPPCVRGDSQLLLPDLVADNPSFVRTALRGGRRLLEFTTAVSNIGDGPLIIDGHTISTPQGVVTQGFQIIRRKDGSSCARHAGFFEYHRAHSHWHFGDFIDYELRTGDPVNGPLATTGVKASYCLLDIEQIRGVTTPRQLTNQTCNSQEGQQGISVGWKDVYDRTLPDQNLDLDDPVLVPSGPYYIINRVDGRNRIWEKNENNNLASTQTSVTVGPRVFPTYPSNDPTATAPAGVPTPTPPRSGRPQHPDRAPRPTRRPAGRTPPSSATSTATPRPTSAPGGTCRATCPYALQQVRLTWYDAGGGGLNLSLGVRDGSCPALSPSAGDNGTIVMNRWLTQAGRDTGRLHQVSLKMDSASSGVTSDSGMVHLGASRGGSTFTYTSLAPPIAGAGLGIEFPVVFDLCVNIGDQTFSGRLVCQEKPRGLLCHEG